MLKLLFKQQNCLIKEINNNSCCLINLIPHNEIVILCLTFMWRIFEVKWVFLLTLFPSLPCRPGFRGWVERAACTACTALIKAGFHRIWHWLRSVVCDLLRLCPGRDLDQQVPDLPGSWEVSSFLLFPVNNVELFCVQDWCFSVVIS
jgi:hypothetical protein